MLLFHLMVVLYITRTVPFEEDDKDPSIWFLDHNYHESMFEMFKRINGRAILFLQSFICLFTYNCFMNVNNNMMESYA